MNMQDTKEQSFEKIMEYEKKIHEKNQQRIRIGIRLVIIIPLIFLAVMFKLDSSKVVFLVLWIVSLFAISLYLIVVEYMDYQMQEKLKELGIKDEDADIKGLISDDLVVEKVIESTGLLEDKKPEVIELGTVSEQAVTQETVSEPEPVAETIREEAPVIEHISDAEYDHEDEMTRAEEELVESIRKYVETLGRQAKAAPAIDEIQRRDAQDYAAMRKARAASRHLGTQGEEKN